MHRDISLFSFFLGVRCSDGCQSHVCVLSRAGVRMWLA